jgi:hypothetical protein
MPVEIKELIIRAVTTPTSSSAEGETLVRPSPEDQQALIEEVVRQVLRILQKERER